MTRIIDSDIAGLRFSASEYVLPSRTIRVCPSESYHPSLSFRVVPSESSEAVLLTYVVRALPPGSCHPSPSFRVLSSESVLPGRIVRFRPYEPCLLSPSVRVLPSESVLWMHILPQNAAQRAVVRATAHAHTQHARASPVSASRRPNHSSGPFIRVTHPSHSSTSLDLSHSSESLIRVTRSDQGAGDPVPQLPCRKAGSSESLEAVTHPSCHPILPL